MLRHGSSSMPRTGKITTVVLAAPCALLLLGCTGDRASIGERAREGRSTGSSGAMQSSRDPAALEPGAAARSAAGLGGAPALADGEEPFGSRLRAEPGAAPEADAGAGSLDGGASGRAGSSAEGCWRLPAVNRARLYAAPGAAEALAGGKIVGSNTSPMNGFVDLAVVSGAVSEGQWVTLSFANATPYRYVKYYGPAESHGRIAELELYQGQVRLAGAAFGSVGAGDGAANDFERALDGDTATWFEGALPSDNYVGIDVAAGHLARAPSFTPADAVAAPGDSVTLAAESGASIFYTLDGSDPRGEATRYTQPVPLPEGTTLLRAVAKKPCAGDSETVQVVYDVPAAATTAPAPPAPVRASVLASMHIGNSLTDTLNGYLEPLAQGGGITLAFARYTIPGAGTWLYDQNPTGGFGVDNVQTALLTRRFDHLSLQPYPNLPCQPLPSSDGPDSDSGYINQAWADARSQNPDLQLWIYQQWPAPTDFVNCITGGAWTRADWQPPAPESWEDAVANELTYDEVVRSELVRLNPDAPEPYIVPAGLALLSLKHAIEAGQVPGIDDFFGAIFMDGGADIHLTGPGAYLVSLVFYACMFQANPAGLPDVTGGELTDEQRAIFQRLAWKTVTDYALSGVSR